MWTEGCSLWSWTEPPATTATCSPQQQTTRTVRDGAEGRGRASMGAVGGGAVVEAQDQGDGGSWGRRCVLLIRLPNCGW